MAGTVFVDGRKAVKAGSRVAPVPMLQSGEPLPYVSRGGTKLEKALITLRLKPPGGLSGRWGLNRRFYRLPLTARAAKVYAWMSAMAR